MNDPTTCGHSGIHLPSLLCGRPQAIAGMKGSESYPDVSGKVRFFQTRKGVIVCAGICGLPRDGQPCRERIFGFHIHAGTDCGGSGDDPFANALSHYNPEDCDHPYHAGDLPPLFGNDGYALSLFLTNRFSVDEIIGKTVIIHAHPDDLKTAPSGNSGAKIACGVIRRTSPAKGR